MYYYGIDQPIVAADSYAKVIACFQDPPERGFVDAMRRGDRPTSMDDGCRADAVTALLLNIEDCRKLGGAHFVPTRIDVVADDDGFGGAGQDEQRETCQGGQ